VTFIDPEPTAWARLFVGLWPDASVREAIIAQRRAWVWPPGVALTPPERLHLTLQFLGAVARERVAALVQGLDVSFEPFELQLVLSEVWSGGIAVLRPTTTPAPMRSLHVRLGAALRALEQPAARDGLQPHVTLARRAAGAVPPSDMATIRWPVGGYVLIESGLPPPRRYRLVAQYP